MNSCRLQSSSQPTVFSIFSAESHRSTAYQPYRITGIQPLNSGTTVICRERSPIVVHTALYSNTIVWDVRFFIFQSYPVRVKMTQSLIYMQNCAGEWCLRRGTSYGIISQNPHRIASLDDAVPPGVFEDLFNLFNTSFQTLITKPEAFIIHVSKVPCLGAFVVFVQTGTVQRVVMKGSRL